LNAAGFLPRFALEPQCHEGAEPESQANPAALIFGQVRPSRNSAPVFPPACLPEKIRFADSIKIGAALAVDSFCALV